MLTPRSVQATQTLRPDPSSRFLDDGCGRGTATLEVKKSYPDASVVAVDNAAGMLEHFDERVKKHDWKNVSTKQLDGGDLTGTYFHQLQLDRFCTPAILSRLPCTRPC